MHIIVNLSYLNSPAWKYIMTGIGSLQKLYHVSLYLAILQSPSNCFWYIDIQEKAVFAWAKKECKKVDYVYYTNAQTLTRLLKAIQDSWIAYELYLTFCWPIGYSGTRSQAVVIRAANKMGQNQ